MSQTMSATAALYYTGDLPLPRRRHQYFAILTEFVIAHFTGVQISAAISSRIISAFLYLSLCFLSFFYFFFFFEFYQNCLLMVVLLDCYLVWIVIERQRAK